MWWVEAFTSPFRYSKKSSTVLTLDEHQERDEPSDVDFPGVQIAECNRLRPWLMREMIAVHELEVDNNNVEFSALETDNEHLLDLWVDEILKSKIIYLIIKWLSTTLF